MAIGRNKQAQLACQPSEQVLREIEAALLGLSYGSIEVYVTAGKVSQITRRVIKKIK